MSSDDESDVVMTGRIYKSMIQHWGYSSANTWKTCKDSARVLAFSPIHVIQDDKPISITTPSLSPPKLITIMDSMEGFGGYQEKSEDVYGSHQISPQGSCRARLLSPRSRIFLDLTSNPAQSKEEFNIQQPLQQLPASKPFTCAEVLRKKDHVYCFLCRHDGHEMKCCARLQYNMSLRQV